MQRSSRIPVHVWLHVLSFIVLTGSASATQISWKSASDGKWSVGGNWDLGRAAADGDDVVIHVAGSYTVTLDVDAKVKSIALGGGESGVQTLSIDSRTLTLSDPAASQVRAAGVLNVSSATITGDGSIKNEGSISLVNSTIDVALDNLRGGSIGVYYGASTLNGAFSNAKGASLGVACSSYACVADAIFANGFVNDGYIGMGGCCGDSSQALEVQNGALVNSSTGEIYSGGGDTYQARYLRCELDNQGLITIDGPGTGLNLSKPGAHHTNSGTINVSGTNFSIAQSGGEQFTNTGTINVADGRKLIISGGTFANPAGGALALTNATLELDSTTVSLDIDYAHATGNTLACSSSTINGDGSIQNEGYIALTNSTVNVPLDNLNGGSIGVYYGTSTFNGAFSNAEGASLTVACYSYACYAYAIFANGFVNDGYIGMGGCCGDSTQALEVQNGTLVNSSTGEIYSGGGDTYQARYLRCELDNQGLITIDGPGTGLNLSKPDAHHTNSGTIDVSGTNFSIAQSGGEQFTNTGTINVADGRKLIISGGAFANPAEGSLALTNATLELDSTTVSLDIDYAHATGNTIACSNSTITGDGSIKNEGYISLANSTIDVALDNLKGGSIGVYYGTSTLNGAFSNGEGASLAIACSSYSCYAYAIFANGFVNDGYIGMGGCCGDSTQALEVQNGTLVNSSTGEIYSGGGDTYQARYLRCELDNAGLITIDGPGTGLNLSKPDAHHTNSGTINVSGTNFSVAQSGTSPTFTNTGTIDISAGHTMNVQSGAFAQTAGEFLLGGKLALDTVQFELGGGVLKGTGQVNGAVNNAGGAVAPGFSVGKLTINGDYTQGAGGTLAIELGGVDDGTFDRLIVSGAATLDGLLDASPADNFAPEGGDRFTFLDAGSRSGEFAVINPNCTLGPVRVEYADTSATLVIIASSRGDLNCDCSIDFRDIDPFVVALVGRSAYEQQYPGCDFSRADIDCNGVVNFEDIDGFVNCIIIGECDACP